MKREQRRPLARCIAELVLLYGALVELGVEESVSPAPTWLDLHGYVGESKATVTSPPVDDNRALTSLLRGSRDC